MYRKSFSSSSARNIKPHRNNLKYKQINEKIKHLTDDYTLGRKNIDQYLTGIAYNIAQPTSISLWNHLFKYLFVIHNSVPILYITNLLMFRSISS